METRFERMRPDELEAAIKAAPVAYVPLGTLEHHGWHLPFGFDALKARALCERMAGRTGGVVLPATYFGFAGGHSAYFGSIITGEACFRENVRHTCDRLIAFGFKVLVLLTGHYPDEQVAATEELAEEVMEAHPGIHVIGTSDADAFPGEFRGDHAAKWETSIAMALMPELTDLDRLDLADDPLYALYGEDPRSHASPALGEETVEGIVSELTERVLAALAQAGG